MSNKDVAEEIKRLIASLRAHRPHDGEGLTLPELGALVVIAGEIAGFKVATEHAVLVVEGLKKGKGRLDCVWQRAEGAKDAGRVIVAWEFDCWDVGSRHLNGSAKNFGTLQKLRATGAQLMVQALYSRRSGVKRLEKHSGIAEMNSAGMKRVTDAELLKGKLAELALSASLLA